jgi:hypothetical protein
VNLSIEALLVRLLSFAGATAGLALLVRPHRTVAALCPELPGSRIWVVRVLGARMVVQHAVLLATPRPSVVRVAAAVDLGHAATMAPFVASARYGRAARISGGVAVGYAALAAALTRREARDRVG